MERIAVIYTRISRDREGAGLGVERQRSDCQDLADNLGWSVAHTYSDNDVSAFSGRVRPEYAAMLTAVEDGTANAIIAWHADRLHRSPRELETFIDLCDRRGVDIRTVQAGTIDLSTASGKMVARMLGAAARHEVEHSSERQRRAKLAAAVAGKFRGGRRPFGFDADGVTVRPDEARVITQATGDVLAGVSLTQIARRWNNAGLRTSMGGDGWDSRRVRNVLLRPRNAALITHEGQIIGPATWPALVAEGDFYALTAKLRDPSRLVNANEKKYMGSGIYRCGLCGAAMVSHFGAASRPQRRGYRCGATAHLFRVGDPLDHYVSDLVVARLSRPDAALVLGKDAADLGAMSRARDGLQARLDELAAMFAEGAVDGTQLRAGTVTLRAKLAAADSEIARGRSSSVLASLVLAGDDLAQVWAATSADLRGKIVNVLMTVTVLKAPRGRQPGGGYFNPEFVQIEWKVGE